MSSNDQRAENIGCGTNSPPAKDEKPMGRASVDSPIEAGHVSDKEQRKEYFGWMDDKPEAKKGESDQKIGQSLAASMEERGH